MRIGSWPLRSLSVVEISKQSTKEGSLSEKRKYVKAAERAMGRSMPKGAVVHHVDRDRTNGANNNLVILQSCAEHLALHHRLRVLRAGGNPWTQHICATCQVVKDLTMFSPRKTSSNGRSVECRRCVADRTHSIWCKKEGREDRFLTTAEMGAKQSRTALSRWAKEKEGHFACA